MAAKAAQFTVQLRPMDWQFAAPADQSLLQSALQAGIKLPSACRNGTCRVCLCRLEVGQAQYRIDWPGVSLDEKREGWILPCVAYPTSDLVLSQPAALRCV
jgi:ferredoxin